MAKKHEKRDSRGRIIPSGGHVPPAARGFRRVDGLRVTRKLAEAISILDIYTGRYLKPDPMATWRNVLGGNITLSHLFKCVEGFGYRWDSKRDQWVNDRFEAAQRDSVRDLVEGRF